MRIVQIHLEDNDVVKETLNAIGYLSMWALNSYNEVRIGEDAHPGSNVARMPNLIALYLNSPTNSRYTIGAIVDERTGVYSFHS